MISAVISHVLSFLYVSEKPGRISKLIRSRKLDQTWRFFSNLHPDNVNIPKRASVCRASNFSLSDYRPLFDENQREINRKFYF